MPLPNRHFLFSGFIGALTYLLIPGKVVALLAGAFVSFILHIPTDLAFPEYWDRTLKESLIFGSVLGFAALVQIYFAGVVLHWGPATVLLLAAILPDIIDTTLEYFHKGTIFPCHFNPVTGKQPWPNWTKQESFNRTLNLELVAAGIMVVLFWYVLPWVMVKTPLK